MRYKHRVLESALKKYLNFFSAIGITGPRQSGKSTLLQYVLPDYVYISFDKDMNRAQFYDDPERFMRLYQNKVIFDEVQKVPEIFEYVKVAVDEDRDNPGKYILTGSSQFKLVQKITESLAGRIGLLTLLPFEYSELPQKLRTKSIVGGCFPELVSKEYALTEGWYSSYLNTYIERDVRDLSKIGDLRDFRRLISLLAANTSQILNMSQYAADLGVGVKSVKRWISILEASYIIFILPPYFKNYGKRITKSPKIYFYDTGLVCYLAGIETYDQFEKGPMSGALFENYIVSEIIKKEKHRDMHSEYYYLRTSHGIEVDLIIDRRRYKDLIEIKLAETYRPKMLKAVEQFLEPDDKGYLLYRGKEVPAEKPLQVMNYQKYLEKIAK